MVAKSGRFAITASMRTRSPIVRAFASVMYSDASQALTWAVRAAFSSRGSARYAGTSRGAEEGGVDRLGGQARDADRDHARNRHVDVHVAAEAAEDLALAGRLELLRREHAISYSPSR
jgi:hypothetical protein